MKCVLCPEPAHGRDGLCKTCRIRMHVKKAKYPFTPELDEKLTKAYREHGNTGKIKALNDLVRSTRYPRFAFLNRAVKLGLRTRTYQHWTAKEITFLEEYAGERSLRWMSEQLGRPMNAIAHKARELRLSAEVTSGYTCHQLSQLFGVKQYQINQWIARGYMTFCEVDRRVSQKSVEQFVWNHMEKYRFASCEEWWLKTMLNPKYAQKVAA